VRFARLIQRRGRVPGGPSDGAASGGNLGLTWSPPTVMPQDPALLESLDLCEALQCTHTPLIEMEEAVTTAIIGVGNIGSALARNLVRGGERVVVAARDESHAQALAKELGGLATAVSVRDAIAAADVVVLAIWLDQDRELVPMIADLLDGKVVVDPSNPIGIDDGKVFRTLPEGTSAGSVVVGLLPAGAHYVKAFGTLGAASLAAEADRAPRRVVLFYATDDEVAAVAAERLIGAAGFEPVKAGGVANAARLEVPGGDLHQNGGLNGRVLDLDQARAAVAATP
jgi:8-hydroxy-5-deazaflavin:NADPH oxidoreductase